MLGHLRTSLQYPSKLSFAVLLKQSEATTGAQISIWTWSTFPCSCQSLQVFFSLKFHCWSLEKLKHSHHAKYNDAHNTKLWFSSRIWWVYQDGGRKSEVWAARYHNISFSRADNYVSWNSTPSKIERTSMTDSQIAPSSCRLFNSYLHHRLLILPLYLMEPNTPPDSKSLGKILNSWLKIWMPHLICQDLWKIRIVFLEKGCRRAWSPSQSPQASRLSQRHQQTYRI